MVYGCKLWNVGRLVVKEMVNMSVYVRKVPVGKIFDVYWTDKKGKSWRKALFTWIITQMLYICNMKTVQGVGKSL